MDIIGRASQRRDQLKAELARIESFLATAYELQQELSGSAASKTSMTDIDKADLPARRTMAARGSGAQTLDAVVQILRERGMPMSTRDLLPSVLARGIEVGGKDPIATLSARISSKGIVRLNHGKWWLVNDAQEKSAETSAEADEAADTPDSETSAASLFNASQGERRDAAALAS